MARAGVDGALAVGLGEPAEHGEALLRIVGAAELVLLRLDELIEDADPLLQAGDRLAGAVVVGVGGLHALPGVEGAVEVAEAALTDLGELDELLGEGGVVEGRAGAAHVGGLIDLIQQEVAQVRPGVLAPPVLFVALEGDPVEGLALEDLEEEVGGALVVVQLVAVDLGGAEEAGGGDGVGLLLGVGLEQADERLVVAEAAVELL